MNAKTLFTAPSHLARAMTDRRRTTPLYRLRRFVTTCVVDTDLNTMALMVMSFHLTLICGLLMYGDIVLMPPPPFIEGIVVRLPAMGWAPLLGIGVLWHSVSWRANNPCLRRNVVLFNVVVTCMLAGAFFNKAPVISLGTFAVNIWQIILAARLHVQCVDAEDDD